MPMMVMSDALGIQENVLPVPLTLHLLCLLSHGVSWTTLVAHVVLRLMQTGTIMQLHCISVLGLSVYFCIVSSPKGTSTCPIMHDVTYLLK